MRTSGLQSGIIAGLESVQNQPPSTAIVSLLREIPGAVQVQPSMLHQGL